MKGIVLLGNRQAEVREFPDPQPGPGEVLIGVKAAGLCGSDLHFYRRPPEELGPLLGAVIGHEPSGVVEAVGPGVRYFQVGDRVALNHNLGCGHCEFCLAGETVHCPEHTGIARAGRGGDAEYVVMPERYCYRLPDQLSFVEGTFIACTGATAYGALRKLKPSGRDNLVVFGLGPVGLSAVLIGQALGARVIGVDILLERLELAKQLGVSEIVDASHDDPVQAIRLLTRGRGAELALEASGSPLAQDQIVDSVCTHGKVAYVGRGTEVKSVGPEQLIRKEVTLMGSAVLPLNLYWEMVRFMLDRNVRFEKMVTHRVGLDQGPQAFSLFDSGAAGKFVFTVD